MKEGNAMDEALRAANPADRDMLERLDLEQARREHLAGIGEEGRGEIAPPRTSTSPRLRLPSFPAVLRPRLGLALGAAAAIAAAAVMLGLGLGSTGAPTPALGAVLQRLAKVSPHLLLDAPGWRAEAGYRVDGGAGFIRFRRPGDGGSAELAWRAAPTAATRPAGPRTEPLASSAALGTRAAIYARKPPGTTEREYYAVWSNPGRILRLSAKAPSLGAFARTLSDLHRVGESAWLAALPRRLVRRGEWFSPEQFACAPSGPDGTRVCTS